MASAGTHYMQKSRKQRVIVCEELNFVWDAPELKEIAKYWELSGDIRLIAKHFDRDPDEVLIALIHLARKDKITRREGGLLLEHRFK